MQEYMGNVSRERKILRTKKKHQDKIENIVTIMKNTTDELISKLDPVEDRISLWGNNNRNFQKKKKSVEDNSKNMGRNSNQHGTY